MTAVVFGVPTGRVILAAQYAAIATGNYRRSDGLHAAAVRRRLAAVGAAAPARIINYVRDPRLRIPVA